MDVYGLEALMLGIVLFRVYVCSALLPPHPPPPHSED